MEYVRNIYIKKFINYYIDEYGQNDFINENNEDLWELFVINYNNWCRTFGLNPNYHKNERERNYFIDVINKFKLIFT